MWSNLKLLLLFSMIYEFDCYLCTSALSAFSFQYAVKTRYAEEVLLTTISISAENILISTLYSDLAGIFS